MYKLNIDNKKEQIQGIKFNNRKLFLDTRTIVEAEHLEGWKPTQKDIVKMLKHSQSEKLKKQVESELDL